MSSKKILLTGASGNLGQAILNSGYFSELLTPNIDLFDLRDADSINKFFNSNNFGTIIHCAALARMSVCQIEPISTIETNIIGTANLVKEVMKKEISTGKKIRFIHISTDAVYSGTDGNYSEKDQTIPYNNYGWSKLGAECIVNLLSNFCIVRTSFFNTKNILFNESAKDMFSSKMPIENLVKAISKLIEHDFIGTINIGSKKKSEYERYKEYKPTLKKCKFNDILKSTNIPMWRDASMNCNRWNKLCKAKN